MEEAKIQGDSKRISMKTKGSLSLETQLIRPCDRYEDEYEECKSSKSRRHQIFVHGEVLNCETWANDLANCQKWSWTGDEEAAESVIQNEKKRLEDRLIPHLHNKVWSKREKPPEDWNKPLPAFDELNKNSYLAKCQKEGKDVLPSCILQ